VAWASSRMCVGKDNTIQYNANKIYIAPGILKRIGAQTDTSSNYCDNI